MIIAGGAVAFSCAHIFPNAHGNRDLFAVTTTMVIIVSMYLLGAMTVPVLDFLGISKGCTVERQQTCVFSRGVEEGRTPHEERPRRVAAAHSEAPRPSPVLQTLRRFDEWIYPVVTVGPAEPRNDDENGLLGTAPPRDAMELVEFASTVE